VLVGEECEMRAHLLVELEVEASGAEGGAQATDEQAQRDHAARSRE
jgi:hypothetical protein